MISNIKIKNLLTKVITNLFDSWTDNNLDKMVITTEKIKMAVKAVSR